MSGAQALSSTPMTSVPPPARDAAGQTGADAANAEAAGAYFSEALGEVDQQNQPSSGSPEESAGEGESTPLDATELTQVAASAPIGSSLAAALAALGLPWAPPAPAQDSSMDVSATHVATQDPLAALASALAANDTEPVSTAQTQSEDMPIEEFIDIHILGRERHLGVADSTTQTAATLNRVAETADLPEDAEQETVALPSAEGPEAVGRAVAKSQMQQTSTVDEQASAQDAAMAMPQEQTKSRADVQSDRTDKASDHGRATTVPGVLTASRQEAGSQGSNLNGSSAQSSEAARSDDVAVDATSSGDGQFTQVMQRTTTAGDPTLDLDGGTVAVSAATQILDQLSAADARDVISAVRSDGDTRVIELQLKPENLGAVTVRVSLKDDVISLKLEAQRADTALEIGREVDKLANSLKQAGYVVDAITTQQMDPRTLGRIDTVSSSSSSSASTQGQSQGSAQGQSFQGGGASSQQNGQGRASGNAFDRAWATGTNDGQNNGLASERQTGLYV